MTQKSWTVYDGNAVPVGDVTIANAWKGVPVYFAVAPDGAVYPHPYESFEAAAHALTPHVRRVVPKHDRF